MFALALKQELPIGQELAFDCVVSALQGEGFAIIAKISLAYDRRQDSRRRLTLIRACFPREECLAYVQSRRNEKLIRCSILIQELETQKVSVEISRASTLSVVSEAIPDSVQRLKLVSEVDEKLRRISARLSSEINLLNAS